MKKFILVLLIISSLILFSYYSTPSKGYVAGTKTITKSAVVSVSVGGEYRFTLFGYTSPQAKVTIAGLSMFDETYADDKGYFIFNHRFSPSFPQETCLTAQDVLGRLSPPLCLAPFPIIYNVEIGPVIMPPTLSADIGEYFVGDEAMLSGQTIPNKDVDLSFFTQQPAFRTLSLKVVKPVEAYSFPELTTKSDEKGNFSISIPTSNPTTLRTFARASFENSPSPKSLTLSIKVLPWWMIILKIFGLVFDLLKKHWLAVSFLVEFIILILMINDYLFHPHRLSITRVIVIREKRALQLKEERPLILIK